MTGDGRQSKKKFHLKNRIGGTSMVGKIAVSMSTNRYRTSC